MKFSPVKQKISHIPAETAVFFVSQNKNVFDVICKNLPKSLHAHVRSFAKKTAFEGKSKQILAIQTQGEIASDLLLCVGLGKYPSSIDVIREACAIAVQTASKYLSATVAFSFESIGDRTDYEVGRAVAEGAVLGSYTFHKYKKKKEPKNTVRIIQVLAPSADFTKGIDEGAAAAEAANFAKDLVNEAPARMTPKDLVDTARAIAGRSSRITINVFNKQQLTKKNFGGILAIAQGSLHDPYFIHLAYTPATGKKNKKIALVGKGVTFDSGGLSLKPAQYMDNMKMDMAGAAAVLGVFAALEKLGIHHEVHGYIPTCENMPSGNAVRVGDVVVSKSGKTIEIKNTDAEGRVILADALTYALDHKPDMIIDYATLTGACIVALGDDIAGVMGNNQHLVDELLQAAERSGEKHWSLPLEKTYKETLKSDIADITNLSSMKGGGAITGAQFLEYFVGKTPWAHVDIAGSAWAEHPRQAYLQKGATGFGVRTLLQFLRGS